MQQATHAHSGVTPVPSSGIIQTDSAPSRRALLGFVGVGALALAAPIAAAPASSPAWDHAWAAFRAATDRTDAFHETYLRPLWNAYPRNPCIDPVQVGTNRTSGQPIMSQFHPADFDNTDWHVYQQNRGFIAARARYLDYVKARSSFEARTNYSYYEAMGERLDSEAYQARCKMFSVPAPHAQALCLKLMTALDPKDGSDIDANEELAAILRADAIRLQSNG